MKTKVERKTVSTFEWHNAKEYRPSGDCKILVQGLGKIFTADFDHQNQYANAESSWVPLEDYDYWSYIPAPPSKFKPSKEGTFMLKAGVPIHELLTYLDEFSGYSEIKLQDNEIFIKVHHNE